MVQWCWGPSAKAASNDLFDRRSLPSPLPLPAWSVIQLRARQDSVAPKYLRKSTKFMGQADMRAARRLTNLVPSCSVLRQRETPEPSPYSGERAWGWDGKECRVTCTGRIFSSFLAVHREHLSPLDTFSLSIMFSVVSARIVNKF